MAALELAAEFPAATEADWLAAAADVLRRSGADLPDDPVAALSSETYEGVRIRPLYTHAPAGRTGLPGRPPFVRGARPDGAWDLRSRHGDPDPVHTNRAILADLHSGATSLWLLLGEGYLAVGDLDRALAGVHLGLVPIALDAGAQTALAAAALQRIAAERGVSRTGLGGTLGADPIGVTARTGAESDLPMLPPLVESIADCPALRAITVDGTVYHDAGGSDADEIAVATSVGVAYLRVLTGAGISVEETLAQLEFRLAVTADQFGSMAKLRAARRVWDRVAALCGVPASSRGQRQHAVTSGAMMTRRDPWVNMLRTTIACFAAAVGGAEAITVAPFDSALGLPDDFGRRIARNTSSVLHDEASLSRVIDPARGSWYVESRTEDLAHAAWDRFTALERSGGATNREAVRTLLAGAAAARDENIARRRDPITGVSEFALVDERLLLRPPAPTPPAGGLPRRRYAEGFEALRHRADSAGQRPTVFLAALGPAAAHSARTAFATNLFAAGGITCVVGADVDEFVVSGSSVVCLSASDAIYVELAPPLVLRCKAAGARRIWLTGRVEVEGVDGCLYPGCDAVEVLTTTLDDLGVPG
jgi:methylmalonyl-CoA mutase